MTRLQSCQASRFECDSHAIWPILTPHARLDISHAYFPIQCDCVLPVYKASSDNSWNNSGAEDCKGLKLSVLQSGRFGKRVDLFKFKRGFCIFFCPSYIPHLGFSHDTRKLVYFMSLTATQLAMLMGMAESSFTWYILKQRRGDRPGCSSQSVHWHTGCDQHRLHPGKATICVNVFYAVAVTQ